MYTSCSFIWVTPPILFRALTALLHSTIHSLISLEGKRTFGIERQGTMVNNTHTYFLDRPLPNCFRYRLYRKGFLVSAVSLVFQEEGIKVVAPSDMGTEKG